MPAWEQMPASRGRSRIAAWGLALLAAMAAAFSTVLGATLVAVIAMCRPRRRPATSRPERAWREAGDHQGPPGHG